MIVLGEREPSHDLSGGDLSPCREMLMEFWFSGELDHRVGEPYRRVSLRVEARLNARCGHRHYGDAITKIAIIPMILGRQFLRGRPERRLWQRKQRTADYRTTIDFDRFRFGDDRERERLLVQNTLDAVRDLQRKAGRDFNGDALVSDILAEFPDLRGADPQSTGTDQ